MDSQPTRDEWQSRTHDSRHENPREKIEADQQKMDNVNKLMEAAKKFVWSKFERVPHQMGGRCPVMC
jgi:hypothetical protein